MFDWDDLRVFITAARAETATGAAQQLGMDASTVGRRIAALEASLKATLFVRSAKGLRLTATGARLLDAGLAAEAAMNLAAEVGEQDIVGGAIRISASEGFGGRVLAPALPQLRARHPGLSVELAANPGFMSPLRREVDMTVTLSEPTSRRLLVEPLTDYQLGLYASPAYLAAHGAPQAVTDLRDASLVGYIDDQIYAPELRYLDEVLPGLTPNLASSSINAQREMIAAGGGVGVLPCFLGQGLERVLRAEVRLTRRFWIATLQEIATTARVRSVRSWMKGLVEDQRALLSPDNA
ncbi:MAG: LysR family transcriptional regulator [Caulobacteraceae bacterium]|nr:LysR family transcriptional regulator [Caulobacteraceae bacterium]